MIVLAEKLGTDLCLQQDFQKALIEQLRRRRKEPPDCLVQAHPWREAHLDVNLHAVQMFRLKQGAGLAETYLHKELN